MLRWAVRGALVLGVAAPVAANILHAQPHPVSRAIAAWPPLALLLTVEPIVRVPVYHRGLAAARLVAIPAIAGIAAWGLLLAHGRRRRPLRRDRRLPACAPTVR